MEVKPEIAFETKACHLLGATHTLNTLARLAVEAYGRGEDNSAEYNFGRCIELLQALAKEVEAWK
jgi:uncharacterized protein with PIN domain